MTKGVDPDIRERLADGFALGTEAFREQVRHLAKGGRETTQTRELRRRVAFTDLLAMVETLRGEKVEDVLHQRGDWARPILLWAARRYTGMTLREIGAAAGGADYTAVAMTIKRFEQKAASNENLRRHMEQIKDQCDPEGSPRRLPSPQLRMDGGTNTSFTIVNQVDRCRHLTVGSRRPRTDISRTTISGTNTVAAMD